MPARVRHKARRAMSGTEWEHLLQRSHVHHSEQDDVQSLDYEVNENMVWRAHVASKSNWAYSRERGLKWVVALLVGMATALVAYTIDMFIRGVAGAKFTLISRLIVDCDNCFWSPFLSYIAVNVLLVSVAAFAVAFIEPVAAGSGIPEIKCYLNGYKIPHVVRLSTLLCKAGGVMFSVAGGLAVGREGPMIHSGAVLAAGISQGKATSLPLDSGLFKTFRNDHMKRDFVASGAAAGVSAAFGSPIGGVLFSLEEGASHWNQALTWRTFFCTMISSFTLNLLLSGTSPGVKWGYLNQPGLVDFGEFVAQSYTVVEIPFFVIIGVVGGLSGAAFNAINTKLTLFRMRFIPVSKPWARFAEALFIAALSATVSFLFAFFIFECRPEPTTVYEGITLRRFTCPEGEYNDMATIFFTTQEEAIRQLFHNRDAFSYPTLAFFMFAYFGLAVVTYGASVPSGLFVPCILTGCAFGRLAGHALEHLFPSIVHDPGTYALVGAAAFLGGVVRMTISLTVIILESTNDISYGLPVMLTIMVSKIVGDLFNEGLYDIHIDIKHIPFLGWEPERLMENLTAADIMSTPVNVLPYFVRVRDVVVLLESNTHGAFPLCGIDENGLPSDQFVGIILRHEIITLLKRRAFVDYANAVRSHVDWLDFVDDYPRYPDIVDIRADIFDEDMDKFMNLSPYMNPAPITTQPVAAATAVFRLFRGLGLRHMVVVDRMRRIMGIVTRHDLVHLEDKFHRDGSPRDVPWHNPHYQFGRDTPRSHEASIAHLYGSTDSKDTSSITSLPRSSATPVQSVAELLASIPGSNVDPQASPTLQRSGIQ
ncbi:chloride channel 7 [Thecamonas trahens ATCC 50062]|uniref:Chloride channel protein n=1 Tax=Thecamonas trahens ATCC 50062 TaxID=461836 RepID=A0A0L0D3L4_THETB|nr:chloride channel 7 [Thecamonas trahens ATCC 50062]KNC46889.1 chloride channel 7 [Thecamonas trahens ATCC 50062]|eukprot:XP_013760162.1 chloride channel 7 [Thecamonas trahens ATCC 50062]